MATEKLASGPQRYSIYEAPLCHQLEQPLSNFYEFDYFSIINHFRLTLKS